MGSEISFEHGETMRRTPRKKVVIKWKNSCEEKCVIPLHFSTLSIAEIGW
jgi:hypothetical protein